MKKNEVSYGPIGGALVVMVLFVVVGYLAGGFFGAFVGACFAYSTWWLKEIHDMLYENNHPIKHD